jgi:hypothetical protein
LGYGFGLYFVQRRTPKLVQNLIRNGIRQVVYKRLAHKNGEFLSKIYTIYIQKHHIAGPKSEILQGPPVFIFLVVEL